MTWIPSWRVIYPRVYSSFVTTETLNNQRADAIAARPRILTLSSYCSSLLIHLNQGYQWLAMEGSSSESGLTVEERIESLENTMGRLRACVDKQDKLLQATNQVGEQAWDILNEDIKKLRVDHLASSENLQDFKEEVHIIFKDVANTHGDFGKRISALEKVVSNLMAKLDK